MRGLGLAGPGSSGRGVAAGVISASGLMCADHLCGFGECCMLCLAAVYCVSQVMHLGWLVGLQLLRGGQGQTGNRNPWNQHSMVGV